MSAASVSIDRTSLALSPLVISDDGAVFRLTEKGVGYVVQSVRTTSAPDSVDVDGSEVLGFAREATALTVEFHIFGASSAAVAASLAELEDALYRLDYPVTRTVDGVASTWSGGPCAVRPARPSVDAGVVAAHFDTFAVTIPFPNPNGS